jgi:hypothetical protein
MYRSIINATKRQVHGILIAGVMVTLLLVSSACSETSPTKGTWFAGDTLQINLVELKRTIELRYPGTNGRHYLVSPSKPDLELVMVRLDIRNARASKSIFTIDTEAATLMGADIYNDVYVPIDVDSRRIEVSEAHASENEFARVSTSCPATVPCVLFLRGPVELLQNFQLMGWMVFEVPKDAELREFKWQAGDTIYMRF